MTEPASFIFPRPATDFAVDRVSYVHDQAAPAEVWTIHHNLGFYPNFIAIDSGGTEIEGDPQYLSENTLQITFVSPFGGKAYLS